MLSIRRTEVAEIAIFTELRLALFRELAEISDQEDSPLLREATHNYFLEALPNDEFIAWVAEVEGKG